MTPNRDEVKDFLIPVEVMLEMIYGEHKNRKTWKIKLSFAILLIFSLIMYIGSFIYIYTKGDNLINLGHAFATIFSHMQATIKLTVLFMNKEKIKQFFYIIKNEFWMIHETDEETKNNILIFVRRLKLFMITYVILMISACVFFTSIPILTENKILPLPAHFFFDESNSPYFEILIVIQSFLLVYNAPIINGSFDCLFAALMANLLAQVEILKYRLRCLSDDNVEINDVLREKKDLKRLKICLKHHYLLIKFGEELHKFYTGIILLQYLATLLATCFTFFILGFLKHMSLLNFLMYLSAHLVQIFLYCLLGSQYEDEFRNLDVHAYWGKWYEYNNSALRSGLRMLMIRAQNTHSFTAGYIINLNLRNFINIIRFSFSVRTLLVSKVFGTK